MSRSLVEQARVTLLGQRFAGIPPRSLSTAVVALAQAGLFALILLPRQRQVFTSSTMAAFVPGWRGEPALFVRKSSVATSQNRCARRRCSRHLGLRMKNHHSKGTESFSDSGIAATRRISSVLPPEHSKRHRSSSSPATKNSVVGIIGKAKVSTESTKETISVPAENGKGLFGVKAKAYWESMGVLPLSFAAFGITALAIKLAKIKRGQWAATDGVNRAATHESIVMTQEEEAELHVFKCGGCGYEMYPARGREFKFFPDSFKCPLCGTPKSEFWDLNDPSDPRNQEDEDEDDSSDDDGPQSGDDSGGGSGDETNLSPTVSVETQAQTTAQNHDSN